MRFFSSKKGWCLVFLCVWLTGCVTSPPPPALPRETKVVCEDAVVPPVKAEKPLRLAEWAALPGWADDDFSGVFPAFLKSCKALSGRAQGVLWREVCEEALQWQAAGATPDAAALRRFFESRFVPYQLTNPDGTQTGRITGYYEPLLNGARTWSETNRYPLLGVPPDLLIVDLSEIAPELKNKRLRGRLLGNRVVPYYSRADIVARETAYTAQTIFWVEDPVELFFLQIQGSGRIRLPSGERVRVGYADQNGHPFRSIGNVLVGRGKLKPEQLSMQSIQAWARNHPDELDAVLNANPSYVFFREIQAAHPDDGPIGALGVPLTAGRSVAVDPNGAPLGAPVFLATTYPNSSRPLRRLMLAQDTGGAIRGVVRADFFWGFGADAGALAGKMKQDGQMWVLLPFAVAEKWANKLQAGK